jgi:hypothetical protein
MSILIASEVLENRELSNSNPYMYQKAKTYLLSCTICANNYLEVFAKDAEFTKFTCEECWY